MILIGGNEKYFIIHSGIPTPDIEQAPVIPFGNKQQYRGVITTFSSSNSLKT